MLLDEIGIPALSRLAILAGGAGHQAILTIG